MEPPPSSHGAAGPSRPSNMDLDAVDEVASPPNEPPAGESGVTRRIRPESITSWGSSGFRITWRAPGKSHVHGAWQGTCVFHRHSSSARCTKSINVASDKDVDRENCLRMVQNWLIQACAFDRAWKHRDWNPRQYETPPATALEAKANSMPKPPAEVLADGELDSVPTPKAKAKGKAGPKGKPSTKPKPKATKKACAKPKLPAESSGSSSSSSSTSSTSSASSSDSD